MPAASESENPAVVPGMTIPNPETTPPTRILQLAFCMCVFALALFQFSENTADVDLWGHILVGQEMLSTHTVAKTETYSWTAQGHPFVYHECGADLMIAGSHALLGGSGPLLLKVLIGLLTFSLCLRIGRFNLPWPSQAWMWVLGGLAVVEISYGFAARPQIFTALGLAVELWLLRRIHQQQHLWALALPLLFLVWINTHGGALAGVGLLGLTSGITTLQLLFGKRSSSTRPSAKTVAALWLALLGVFGGLLINPWGFELIRWLIGSVLWLRPEIEEWNPTPWNWDHAAFFIVLGIVVFAWALSRKERKWWELAACAVFALLAWRSVRNTPLFCIVALALTPVHLADAMGRFRHLFAQNSDRNAHASLCRLGTAMLGFVALAILVAIFTLHKDRAWTMEIPKSQYPVAAVDFMQKNNLSGRLLVFFDWGEMAMFHMTNCPPSIDGRLDTCYPRNLIAAHWNFYNGKPFDEKVLPVDQAELALLPCKLAGAFELAKRPGWKPVYYDDLAVVLVKDCSRYPQLQPPTEGPKTAAIGRDPFPKKNPRWH